MLKLEQVLDFNLFPRLAGTEKQGSQNDGVKCSWSTGCAFLLHGNNSILQIIDSMKNSATVQHSGVKIAEVLHLIEDPHRILVVFEDCQADLWQYNVMTRKWFQSGSVILAPPEGAFIVSACIHNTQGALYWLQMETGSTNCSLWCCTLPKVSEGWSNDGFGAAVAIMEQCPPCDLYPAGDCLLLLPRSNQPRGVFIKWQPSSYSVELHTISHGNILTEKKFSQTVSVNDLLMKTLDYWSQEMSLNWKVLPSCDSCKLYLLDQEGTVFGVNEKEETVAISRFPTLKLVMKDVLGGFVSNRLLHLAVEQSVRVFNLDSSEEALSLSVDSTIQGTWFTCTSSGQGGVWTDTHLYQLTTKNRSTSGHSLGESHKIGQGATGTYQGFAFADNHHSTLHALEKIYSDIKKNNSDISKAVNQLDGSTLQSPALILPLLKETACYDVDADIIRKLQDLALDHPGTDTRLHNDLAPLTNDFWRLDAEQRDVQMGSQMNSWRQRMLHDSVCDILSGACNQDTDWRCGQLILLADKDTEQTIATLVQLLLEQDEPGLWNSLLLSEASQMGQHKGQGQLQILKVICRLIFLHQPDVLVDLIKRAVQMWSKKATSNVFKDQHSQSSLSFEILQVLPDVRYCRKPSASAVAKSQLLLLSDVADKEFQATKCLLDAGLWQEALHLLAEMNDQPKDVGESAAQQWHHLWHYFTNRASDEGVYNTYGEEIIKLAPRDTTVMDLMTVIKRMSVTKLSDEDKLQMDVTKSKSDKNEPCPISENDNQSSAAVNIFCKAGDNNIQISTLNNLQIVHHEHVT